MSLFNKFPHLESVKGKTATEISADIVTLLNAELTTQGISNLSIVKTEELQSVTSKNTELIQTNAALTTENKSLKDKVASLESIDGDKPVVVPKVTDDITADPAKVAQKKLEDLPHMKAVQEHLG